MLMFILTNNEDLQHSLVYLVSFRLKSQDVYVYGNTKKHKTI